MRRSKVLFQRVVSADGRAIAEVRSEVTVSGNAEATAHQSVTIEVSSSCETSSASDGSNRPPST